MVHINCTQLENFFFKVLFWQPNKSRSSCSSQTKIVTLNAQCSKQQKHLQVSVECHEKKKLKKESRQTQEKKGKVDFVKAVWPKTLFLHWKSKIIN
jgi:hypothetical protein